MAPSGTPRRRIVVDGSNIATEGRSQPSLAQLDEAITTFLEEHPGFTTSDITVVVDATFGHRIDPSEVAAFDQAVEHGEMITPPAGALGRGDGFILRIAEKAGAIVLSNDSFQEFHAERPWLFDPGRLIGGKPVPGVGWVFTPRTPVRGAKSRAVTAKSKRETRLAAGDNADAPDVDGAAEVPDTVATLSSTTKSGRTAKRAKTTETTKAKKSAKTAKHVEVVSGGIAPEGPVGDGENGGALGEAGPPTEVDPVGTATKAAKATKTAKAAKATKTAKAAKATKTAKTTKTTKPTKGSGTVSEAPVDDDGSPPDGLPGDGGVTRDGRPPRLSGSPLNDPLTFLNFVAEHPVGSTVEGTVVAFTSHGAHVDIDGMLAHVPLRGLGDPPPPRARSVLAKGEKRPFTLVSLDAPHRRAEIVLPELAPAAVAASR